MLYTLLKFLGWGILLAVIGGCIGWALRALKCRGELARARGATGDDDELERMRDRLADMDQIVAERDRLRMQIADMRHTDSPGVVGAAAVGEGTGHAGDAPQPDRADDRHDDEPGPDGTGSDETGPAEAGAPDRAADPDLDLEAAHAVIGKPIVLDDVTAIEGIGPKIAELCSGIGIVSWRGLAAADVADLRAMLADAGSRYQMHDPTTWPEQAACLAEGRWNDFVALTDGLTGGN